MPSKPSISDNSRQNANIISRFFHHWLSDFLKKGHRQGTLHLHDLSDLPDHLKSKSLTDRLETNWFDEIQRRPDNPSLIRVTLRTMGWKPFLLGFLSLLNAGFQIITPLFLTFLMDFFEPCSTMPAWQAWLFASVTIVLSLCAGLVYNEWVYRNNMYALQITVAYRGLIYRKVLRLSSHAMNSVTSGEIINVLSNDASTIEMIVWFVDYLWVAPVQVLLVTFLFWHYVKYIALIAVGFTIFLLLILPICGRLFAYLRTKTLQVTDKRLKIMFEVIRSMRIVKMYCWESAFVKKICSIRKQEILQYTLYTINSCLRDLLAYNYSSLSFLMMYGAMWAFNVRFDTRFFAILLCVLGSMRLYVVFYLSHAIQHLSDYLSARKRIEAFLLLDECERDTRLLSSSNLNLAQTDERQGKVTCNVKQAYWEKDGLFALKNIVFHASPGDLICIIGPVGSGKSSVLQTLSGEIAYFDGKVRLHGSFCYVPQEAWIFSSTIKNNILSGKEYDHKLFQRVTHATALDTDFEQLSNGANTLVGDHGVMLSGGQKARVNMARALYRNADIYLLDDPLSAVDVKVSKHLFEKSIKRYLADKVSILVTHQVQFLQHATQILLLDHGEIVQMGTYTELLTTSSSFAHLLEDIHQQEQASATNIQQQQSVISTVYADNDEEEDLDTNTDTKQEGAVRWHVYTSYIKAGFGSLLGFVGVLLIFIVDQATAVYSNWSLATWSDDESYRYGSFNNCSSATIKSVDDVRSMTDDEWNAYRNGRFYRFCGAVALLLLLTFLRTFISKLLCLNAGRVLHNRMFQRIVRCPMSFFDVNPVGRIMNRFSSDIAIMDTDLVGDIPDFLDCVTGVLGTVILVGFLNPWSFIPAIAGFIGTLIVRSRFAPCFRDLKRLQGTTLSPVYSYVSSTIHGLKVIRSYRGEEMCSDEFHSHLDDNTLVQYFIKIVDSWSSIRFGWVSLMFLSLVTLFALLGRVFQQEFSPANIALTLSYSLNVMGLFQWTIRQSVTVDTHMTAAERVLGYCTLDQEPPAQVPPNHRPPTDWPSKGEIVFENVSMSYSDIDDTSFALRHISFRIGSGERIGIVGRTGAGKSSLIQILFRMGILADGRILIDSIDIATIGLDDLRSRISIIPQDPALFAGTIRDNLDPFQTYSDHQMWNALEEVQLKHLVQKVMSNGLDSSVSENGSNMSVGQKQLICLARAILKKSQILVIDEATANVDNATDELIQKAIRNKFQGCTVLTVAHRLRTVIDSDRILVLDNGKVVEFETPLCLLSDSTSCFVSLVEQTGPAEAEHLRTLASRAVEKDMRSTFDDDSIPTVNETDPLLQ